MNEPEPPADPRGMAIRAMLYCCQICETKKVVYDARLNNMTIAEGETLIRDHGWVQRHGLWTCPKCREVHPAIRTKYSHLSIIEGGRS